MDAGSVATSPGPEASALAREAKVFQSLLQQRDRWYDQVLNEARVLADEAAEAEAELVHALDRADFAEAQLNSLLRRTPHSKGFVMLTPEHWKLAKNAEMQLVRHLELASEVSEQKDRVAWAVARLRVLQALCTWAESTSPSEGDGGLSAVLRRCEDDLLQACSQDVGTARLASELQAVSPLNLVLPSLLGELRPDEYRKSTKGSVAIAESGANGQEQWLLPLKKSQSVESVSAVSGTPDEDLRRLKREIEDLTDRNEALRSEMRAEPSRRTAPRLPQFALVEGDARQSLEEIAACRASQQRLVYDFGQLTGGAQAGQQLPQPAPEASLKEQAGRAARLQQIAQLRLQLADAYAELARLGLNGAQLVHLPAVSGFEHLVPSLERRLEEARAENAALRAGKNAEARAHQETDLIQRMARNTSEIKSLKEKLRRSEMQDQRRRESLRWSGSGRTEDTAPPTFISASSMTASLSSEPVTPAPATFISASSVTASLSSEPVTPLGAPPGTPALLAPPATMPSAQTAVVSPVALMSVAQSGSLTAASRQRSKQRHAGPGLDAEGDRAHSSTRLLV